MSKPAKTPAKTSEIERLGFEAAVERLERIIDQIERGEVGLEESITEYEQGVALIKRCRAILEQAELRVRELTPDAEPADDPADAPGR